MFGYDKDHEGREIARMDRTDRPEIGEDDEPRTPAPIAGPVPDYGLTDPF